jgi:hypothetical protein
MTRVNHEIPSESIVDAFLPQGPLDATDPFDDVAAKQWATAMTVLGHVVEGATIDMAVDAVAADSSQSRTAIVHAVRRTFREMLAELA